MVQPNYRLSILSLGRGEAYVHTPAIFVALQRKSAALDVNTGIQ